jgi:hypothetical protein
MTEDEIVALIPALRGAVEIKSPADENYNCIAWSLNDLHQWWWPTPTGTGRWPGKYWPTGILNEETLAAFIALYERLGFKKCSSGDFEEGYDKIAIYTDHLGTPTHAARWWQEDLGWSSKLGEENDILHHSLESLEGTAYGHVSQIMKRKRGRSRNSPRVAHIEKETT